MKPKSAVTKKAGSASTSKVDAVRLAAEMELSRSRCTSCPMSTFLVKSAKGNGTTGKRLKLNIKTKILRMYSK
ncbi:hypothetical protein D3C76_1738500 [compost metagenome]